jgi:hypothetical protein
VPGIAVYTVGAAQGFVPLHQLFFGHVSYDAIFSGVIAPGDRNVISTIFYTELFGHPPEINFRTWIGVNHGMDLMGDGTYVGHKRFYFAGFNMLGIDYIDVGATVIEYWIGLNGYIFTVI